MQLYIRSIENNKCLVQHFYSEKIIDLVKILTISFLENFGPYYVKTFKNNNDIFYYNNLLIIGKQHSNFCI